MTDTVPNALIGELTKSVLVKFGKQKRNMECVVLENGNIVAAFPTEELAREHNEAAEALRTIEAERRDLLVDSVFLKSDQKLMHTLRAENEAMPGWKAANRRLADDLLEKESQLSTQTLRITELEAQVRERENWFPEHR